MYELIKRDGMAKRGRLTTVHGTIETPVFMNVGTAAAIKGGVSTDDLRQIKTQVELSNTYHLHVRPGDEVVKKLGGLHKFMNWDKPILTDSGGFQVFSLASLRKIKEEGVHFNSHIDGRKIFMGPEQSMQIQSNLASTIAMAFDECPSSVADKKYMANSVARTTRWLKRCKDEMARLNALPDTINPQQMLFGINQGGIYEDIRIEHAQQISELDLDGYAVGGLAVGESHEEMYRILDEVAKYPQYNCIISGERVCYSTSKNPKFYDHMVNIIKNNMKFIDDPKTEIPEPILKIAVCNYSGTDECEKHLKEMFSSEIKVVTSGNLWVDFICPTANKGSALKDLIAHLHIDAKDCVVFGDQYNDVEMLQTAGTSYAMANAAPGIDKYATHVTDSVEKILQQIIDEL